MIIKINNIDAGFKFNNYAFEHLPLMKGVDSFTSMGTAMIFCAYKGWCYARQKDEQLTFENIIDWIDSGENEDIVRELIAEFENSSTWKQVQESVKKNAELSAVA